MRNVIRVMEKLAPPELAAEWDNIGLIIGGKSRTVTGIVVSLDVTDKAIDAALKTGANLIVTHHPPIFKPLNRLDTDAVDGALIARLMENNINVYSAHTNLDSAPKGINQYVSKMLGLKRIKPVHGPGIIYRMGELSRAAQSPDFTRTVKEKLALIAARHYGPARRIKKVAVCTGAASDILPHAAEQGADLLVTGEVKHHVALMADHMGIPVVDAGHAGTERPMVPLVADYLKKHLTNRGKTITITPLQIEENYREI